MGCTESTPVVEPQRTTVINTAYPVYPNQQISYPPKNEDPTNYKVNPNERPPPYNPNLNYNQNMNPPPYNPNVYQQSYVAYNNMPPQYYPQQQYYHQQYYPRQYPQNNQPSLLGTMGAVAGGVIVGEVVSDMLGFD